MKIPSIEELRHRIDTMTAYIPERMDRTTAATIMQAAQLQGMAIAVTMIRERPLSAEALDIIARELYSLSDQLIDTISDEGG